MAQMASVMNLDKIHCSCASTITGDLQAGLDQSLGNRVRVDSTMSKPVRVWATRAYEDPGRWRGGGCATEGPAAAATAAGSIMLRIF